jgi:hypothetical protein
LEKKTNIGWQWAYDYHLYTGIDDFFGYFEALLHIFKPYDYYSVRIRVSMAYTPAVGINTGSKDPTKSSMR